MHSREAAPARCSMVMYLAGYSMVMYLGGYSMVMYLAGYSMVMYLAGYFMLALAAIHSIGAIHSSAAIHSLGVIGVAESGVFTGWHSICCIGGYLAYYFIRFGFRLGINSIEFGWVYLVRDLGLFIVALPHLITSFAAIHLKTASAPFLITPSINFRL